MPPILASPSLNEATQLWEKLNRRSNDIAQFQIARLRECKGPLSVQQQYAAELREDIDSFQKLLEELELLADDQEKESDRVAVKTWAGELGVTLSQLKKDSRSALLASKRTIDSLTRDHRDDLLRTSAISKSAQSRDEGGDDALMRTSNNVTEALRRTTATMQQELERSVLTTQMLDESSRTLHATSDLYTTFSTLLTTSKTLVTALEKADWLDRLLLLSSLAFFFLTLAYVMKKRVIDRGIWLAFWWAKYVPWKSLLGTGRAEDGTIVSALEKSHVVNEVTTTVAEQVAAATAVLASLATAVVTAPAAEPSSVMEDIADIDSMIEHVSMMMEAPEGEHPNAHGVTVEERGEVVLRDEL
ncbi:hypothetical protein BOTBODRAFT_35042 [Botryobasidium botryosum FD-172 SS1]|uniref:Sec20 C-terminal domain-containing protein n=1 Tax=Botryobasidium botryosum (strain FD-172 SS1) TaxID=930990 RepID=A0A067MIU6_BOTB1|nr:hypothetical protein BOTBODRAFT_35042 [Botryobasidium botryosum FD-172 SS1]